MKDAKGHGSNRRGVHSQGINRLGTYLRIGDWHPSETSRNYALGKTEKGVSVYELDPTGQPLAPPKGEWADTDLRQRITGKEPKYLVQGTHVGVGHDGEPLLKNIKIVGEWKPK